jgi:hypothetical protein
MRRSPAWAGSWRHPRALDTSDARTRHEGSRGFFLHRRPRGAVPGSRVPMQEFLWECCANGDRTNWNYVLPTA